MPYDDTIEVYNDRQKVRNRPGMYIGNNDKLGLSTIVREIIDNALDEYPNYPDPSKPIQITLHSDNSMTVRDYGRGISPYESRKNPGQIAERLAYTKLGAGGKMKDNRTQNENTFSAGLNGVGAAATNFMSAYFDVVIYKDGRIFHDRFENGGEPVVKLINGQLPSKPQTKPFQTGTQVTFLADKTAMRTTHVDTTKLEVFFQQMAYLNAGLKIEWTNERDGDEEPTVYYSKNGLIDYIQALTTNDDETVPLLMKPFIVKGEATADVMGSKVQMAAQIAVAFSKDESYDAEAFTNGTYNAEGGTHLKGFYAGLVKLIKHYYTEFKPEFTAKYKRQIDLILKVNDESDFTKMFKSRDLMHFTYVILDFKHSDPVLQPQTKDSLQSPEARKAVSDIFYDHALYYLDRNVAAVQNLIGEVIKHLYAQAKADDDNVKLNKRDTKLAVSTKLAAARKTGHGKGAELILVEGDSAAGSLKENRDADFQSVLPLRGKVLNVQKSTLSKALQNKEISTIFAVLGAGFGKHYDESKLEYDKVIICTDADTDGAHISVLLQTLFMTYLPELMTNGHVYHLETPLFVNTMKGKQRDHYTYDNDEQTAFLKAHHQDIVNVDRNKGLGELSKDQVIETILTPKTRHLTQIKVGDLDDADDLIDTLMGNNVQGRKRLFTDAEAD